MTIPFPSVWLWYSAPADKHAHRAELKHVVRKLQERQQSLRS